MIYLDSAATSFQKPPAVERAMVEALHEMSSPGRGGYPTAMRAAETALECRIQIQELFSAQSPEQVIFTMNATHALNIAIKSLVPRGGRVVISGYEHNAVTRPLRALQAKVTVADSPLFRPEEAASAFEKAIRPETDAVICSHVSNVFGFIQPIDEIAETCRKKGVPLIVDASQSAGILPLNMRELGAAFVAMPGHKGLYGPQGTGVLLCGEISHTLPLLEGGTGSLSAQQEMPDFLPDRLEVGTHNMPGIAGLLAGVRFIRASGLRSVSEWDKKMAAIAAEGLNEIPGLQVFASPDFLAQSGVVSFLCKRVDTERMAALLGERGIAVRAGLHCAPLAHRSAGTLQSGTVRASFSVFNTEEEVRLFVEEVARIFKENIE